MASQLILFGHLPRLKTPTQEERKHIKQCDFIVLTLQALYA